MPWKSYEEDGRYCVHKLNDDGSKGAVVACHDTQEQADKQVKALYAKNPEARKEKTYTAKEREKATTMADGSFPIDNVADLKRAISSFGRAKNKPAVKAWIKKRAKALGATDLLPEDWRSMPNLDGMAEIRTAEFTDAELKGNTFHGLAAAYDTVADLGQFTESINRGAFRKVLSRGDNVPMLWDHNDFWPPFATTAGGTLELRDDVKGLAVKADLDPNHILDATLKGQIEKGNVRGMSFGFVAGKGNSRIDMSRDKPHRDLSGFNRLLDVSPTWNPAYAGTDAAYRSLSIGQTFEDIERVQQALLGEHRQLEDGAALDDALEEPEAAEESSVEDDGEQSPEEKQPSGVMAMRAIAARKRLLTMQGMRLPKEFRP